MICDSALAIPFYLVPVVSSEDITPIRSKNSYHKCSGMTKVSALKHFPEIYDVLLNLDNCCEQALGLGSVMR